MVKGSQTWYVASGWQRSHIYQGAQSPFDLSDQRFTTTRVHELKLKPGDCIYVPAYWFYQIKTHQSPLFDSFLTIDATLTVTHWYESNSTWLSMVYEGIKAN